MPVERRAGGGSGADRRRYKTFIIPSALVSTSRQHTESDRGYRLKNNHFIDTVPISQTRGGHSSPRRLSKDFHDTKNIRASHTHTHTSVAFVSKTIKRHAAVVAHIYTAVCERRGPCAHINDHEYVPRYVQQQHNGNNGLVAFPGIFGRSLVIVRFYLLSILLSRIPRGHRRLRKYFHEQFTPHGPRRDRRTPAAAATRIPSAEVVYFFFLTRPGRPFIKFSRRRLRRMRTTSSAGDNYFYYYRSRSCFFVYSTPPPPVAAHPPSGFSRKALGPVRRGVFIFN